MWVIVAIFLVAAFILLFLFNKPKMLTTGGTTDPQGVIESCVRSGVLEAEGKMLPQGGFANPTNFKNYQHTHVAYLCQNIGYFSPCIQQHPMLLSDIQREIENYTSGKIEQCFQTVSEDLKRKNYEVTMDPMQFNISLSPGVILVDIQRKMVVSKSGTTQAFDSFAVNVQSPMYDLSRVAMDIASQEAKYCYFEYVGYMILYPRFDIRKFTMSDSTRIYTLKDRYSNKVMNVAIRGCAIPPGI